MNEHSFLITYDLNTGLSETDRGKTLSKAYEDLEEQIKKYGTWAHIQQSCWAVVTVSTAAQIRDDLMSVLHTTDNILVLQSANIAAWHNVMCTNKWMKEHV